MGAWGTGPFDSDNALDFLGNLATEVGATRDDDTGDVIAAAADQVRVARELRTVLAAGTAAGADFYEASDAYTVAGLVAARLSGVELGSQGSNLLTNLDALLYGGLPARGLDTLALDAHCGFLALLELTTAEALRQGSYDAVMALMRCDDFLSPWVSAGEVEAQLRHLSLALTPGAVSAG